MACPETNAGKGRCVVGPDAVARCAEGLPIGVAHGVGVAVAVALLDAGDGPPEAVGVLGIPGRHAGVGHRKINKGEEASVLIERVMLLEGQCFCDLVVEHHRWAVDPGIVGPEVGDLGLARPCESCYSQLPKT